MPVIRCTQKLLKNIPFPIEEKEDTSESLLGNWHANLLTIERRKCVILMNDKTFYSLFIPGLTKPDFKRIPEIFLGILLENLDYCGLSNFREKIISEYQGKSTFGKTNDKSVMGCMNDVKLALEFYISRQGGLRYLDLPDLAKYINNRPREIIKFHTTTETFIAEIKELSGKDIPIIPLLKQPPQSTKPSSPLVQGQLRIRLATLWDAPKLIVLMIELGYPQSLQDIINRLKVYESTPGHFVYVAEQDGKILGFIALAAVESIVYVGAIFRINALVVTQNERGKGIGRKLMTQAEKLAKSKKAKVIELTSGLRRAKDGSHDFYRELGYKNDGPMAKLYLRKEL